MDDELLSPEAFLCSAKDFVSISDRIHDGWKLHESTEIHKCYIQKKAFIHNMENLYNIEFIIFYNLSYGVPAFSFNIWDSSGTLLSLEDIRTMALIEINKKDFYSVITQQEHPILNRPYFIMHPCQTQTLLSSFCKSKNIIVTFLGLITPLINLNLPIEFGL